MLPISREKILASVNSRSKGKLLKDKVCSSYRLSMLCVRSTTIRKSQFHFRRVVANTEVVVNKLSQHYEPLIIVLNK